MDDFKYNFDDYEVGVLDTLSNDYLEDFDSPELEPDYDIYTGYEDFESINFDDSINEIPDSLIAIHEDIEPEPVSDLQLFELTIANHKSLSDSDIAYLLSDNGIGDVSVLSRYGVDSSRFDSIASHLEIFSF